MRNTNRRVTLATRPTGFPKPSDFALVEDPIPEPGPGQVLVRNHYLSLDPYMRGRMNDVKSYVPPVQIGETMVGATAGEVTQSNAPGLAVGDFVMVPGGWQDYSVASAAEALKLDAEAAPISTGLGALGMPGMTAYFGLLDLGQPKPGDTVFVSAASGAVGAVVGQIAKMCGCRTVGSAGSDAKVAYVLDELGFDAAINYKTADLGAAIDTACPDGIDVYFDNVGGAITDAVFERMNMWGRVAVCGQISQYNLTQEDLGPRNLRFSLVNRINIRGFIVFDFMARYGEARKRLTRWYQEGSLKILEDISDGLENAPAGLIGLLQGENFGKKLIRIVNE
ncbi:MAG: NADP-dependent oxidoreductase [Alphaproteobacteria bacterium]|nr:NADP-dependent oxidoreductase [Alphaproteobacteria bacterium]